MLAAGRNDDHGIWFWVAEQKLSILVLDPIYTIKAASC